MMRQWARLVLGCVLMLAGVRTHAGEGMRLTAETPWIVPSGLAEPLRMALRDVERDWYQVFGRLPVVLEQEPVGRADVDLLFFSALQTIGQGDRLRASTEAETFTLRVERRSDGGAALRVEGGGLRGGIFAIYAVSEYVLGVDPLGYWTDHRPQRCTELRLPEGWSMTSGEPLYRLRGWFINDEDLLAGWTPEPLGLSSISLQTWDAIFSTLLRLRGNFIIAGTPTLADEPARVLAHRRGLMVNAHHVGLNAFRWPEGETYSYLSNPDALERMWRTTIAACAKMESIHSINYRGRTDEPFWKAHSEPGLESDAARGEVITRATRKQFDLIREVAPEAPIVTDLYAEGVDLHRAGHLKIPPGVIRVWPDQGTGLLRDGGDARAGDGSYYHLMMFNQTANHFTEMIPIERVYAELGRHARAGATAYCRINVANVRPVPLGIDAVMRFLWQPPAGALETPDAAAERFYQEFAGRQFGEELAEEIGALYRDYFRIPYFLELHAESRKHHGDHAAQTQVRGLLKLMDAVTSTTPQDHAVEACEALRKRAEFDARESHEALAHIEPLLRRAEAVEPRVAAGRREFYLAHVLMPLRVHLHLTQARLRTSEAGVALCAGDRAAALARLGEAERELLAFQQALAETETGRWVGFYQNDAYIPTRETLRLVRMGISSLSGMPPPIEAPWRPFERMQEYFDRYAGNYPLFFPPGVREQALPEEVRR